MNKLTLAPYSVVKRYRGRFAVIYQGTDEQCALIHEQIVTFPPPRPEHTKNYPISFAYGPTRDFQRTRFASPAEPTGHAKRVARAMKKLRRRRPSFT